MPQTYHTYITLSGDHKLRHFLLDIETGGLQFQTTLGMPGGPAPLAVEIPYNNFCTSTCERATKLPASVLTGPQAEKLI